ncbi:MAG: MBL fold metallo-hydrolase [Anaerolineae bacterium]|nr:MBL fold metallo-hydrolase [Thermoflexales bacterium]MDW8407841.1 MBL fold metallo-hydrolase [Anaerolineae bacterium]
MTAPTFNPPSEMSNRRSIELLALGVGPAMGLNGRTTSCYLLRVGERRILIDCGPAIVQQLHAVGVAPHQIDDICFTHAHADHTLGYPMLMLWRLFKAPAGVGLPRIIASISTMGALDGVIQHTLAGEAAIIRGAPRVELPTHEPSSVELADGILLRTWPLAHSPYAPTLGLRFEIGAPPAQHVIAFTGDTGPCDNVVALAHNADLLVHEANFSARLKPELAGGAFGHSTAQIAGRNAAAAHVKHLALVHMDVSEEGQESVFIAEAAAEFDGQISAPMPGVQFTL